MNPYRRARPTSEIIFEGSFQYCDRDGRVSKAEGAYVSMNPEYLWVDDELSIPLDRLVKVECPERKAVGIVYRNEPKKRDESIWLTAQASMGRPDKRQNERLAQMLQQWVGQRPSVHQMNAMLRDEGYLGMGCQVCRRKPAYPLELGQYICLGVYPFAGMYWWKPERRLLCEKHAGRTCLKSSLVTGLLGYLGFPGILVASQRTLSNITQVNRAFGQNVFRTILNLMIGFMIPAAAVGIAIYYFFIYRAGSGR